MRLSLSLRQYQERKNIMSLLDGAQKDSLTMCYAKESLLPFMEKMRAEYAAYRKPFSVMLIDIDGFKSFNDKHGHMFGDEALKYFSSSLRLSLEDEDCVIIRFGGDEFVIIFPGRTPKEVCRLANHTENNIKKRPFLFKGREYHISFSGGIASCPHDGIEVQDILDKADKAMYFSKRHGSGRTTQYSQMQFVFMWLLRKIAVTTLLAMMLIITAIRVFHIDLETIKAKIGLIRKTAFVPGASRPIKVYLRSGNSIEGIITDENDNDISLRFDMATGEGAVSIKKSDIKYIDRNYKEGRDKR